MILCIYIHIINMNITQIATTHNNSTCRRAASPLRKGEGRSGRSHYDGLLRRPPKGDPKSGIQPKHITYKSCLSHLTVIVVSGVPFSDAPLGDDG